MGDTSEIQTTYETVRKPDPNESRLIARHEYKYYNNLVVAGIYSLPLDNARGKVDRTDLFHHFRPGLHECVRTHPFLSVVVKKSMVNQVTYARCSQVNLESHFNLINQQDIPRRPEPTNEDDLIRDIIHYLHNKPKLTFFDSVGQKPSWRIDVLPLEPIDHLRLFVSFTYCHTISDGMSGVAFHKTLLRNINSTQLCREQSTNIISPPKSPLPCLPKLPINMSYLLAPALGLYLPKFIRSLTGFKASVSGADETTWTGSETFFDEEDGPIKTAIEILSIEAATVSRILEVCRKHDTKLTSVLNEVIARCWSAIRPTAISGSDGKILNFVSSTPSNLRKLANIPDDVIGIMASTVYTTHQFHLPSKAEGVEIILDEAFWEDARKGTQHLAASTSTLQNQPIGLLRFISDINGWMRGQIGHSRDASWQLSNLMSFEGGSSGDKATVEKMYFCQPADVVGVPLNFNTVSVKGGDLVICISWQPACMKFCSPQYGEDFEGTCVRELISNMKEYLKAIALSS